MALTTAGIAASPGYAVKISKRKKSKPPISDDYMGVAKGDHPKDKKTLVWQPLDKSSQKFDSWYNKKSVYAATNNPDERLLKNHRGKGY
jgi:hypothetical protein